MIKKKEIVTHVAEVTSLKKYQAREALEATLAFMHERLSDGEEVQVPPLGKLRVILQNEGTPREKTVYRLILSKPKDGDDETVPEPETVAED